MSNPNAVVQIPAPTSVSNTVMPIAPATAADLAIGEKYAQMGSEAGILGKSVSDVVDIGNFGFCRHFNGGSIYWTQPTGAHEVHGDIRGKWSSLGWERGFLGYPVSDETGTPDGIGRYNHFQGGSIYWTPSTGAHEVHGDIRGKWSSLGWEQSYLGYPLSDEHDFNAGRISEFQNGSIVWSGEAGAQVMPQHFVVDAPNIIFGTGLPVGGHARMVLYSDGFTTFEGHLHDSGLPSFDYMAVFTVKGTDQLAYTLTHSGRLHGSDEPGDRGDDWNEKGYDEKVLKAWPAIRSGTGGSTVTITSDWSPQKIAEDVVAAVGFVLAVVAMFLTGGGGSSNQDTIHDPQSVPTPVPPSE